MSAAWWANEVWVAQADAAWLAYADVPSLCTLTDLMDSSAEYLSALPFALIASIDGGRGASLLEMHAAHRGPDPPGGVSMTALDGCLLTTGAHFVRYARDGLADYDEVWFFDRRPARGIPEAANLTGLGPWTVLGGDPRGRPVDPAANADPERRRAVLDYFAETGCRVAAGDGAGLSLVAATQDVLLRLVGPHLLRNEAVTVRRLPAG